MPAVYPFRAVQYHSGHGDVSPVVAPPYDVLDGKSKAALLAGNPNNIVGLDLPHVPAKELGPDSAYTGAGDAYRAMLADGTLSHHDQPAMFAYRQTFQFAGQNHTRSGMSVTIDTRPFGPRDGGGVLPHEQTFSGPKADRLALMKATACQFSPIFGLHPDDDGAATAVIEQITASRTPDCTATLDDGVLHEVWTVSDEREIAAYQAALAGEDIFIADGHHRYNTALNYLNALTEKGDLPADHPARFTMIVLVGMSDPGLVIGPTHRVLGGMTGYSPEAFTEAAGGLLELTDAGTDLTALEDAMDAASDERPGCVLGMVDFGTGQCWVVRPTSDDPLGTSHKDKPEVWRTLDVAIIQYLIVEKICEPKLNEGNPVKWAFPHTIEEVLEIGAGQETGAGGGAGFAQMAMIVRPTPLEAVREVSKANELMPQKSTFFYPKLATGLFLNPLQP
jgi:uncharacterized protein (DUF1015 family)